MKSARWLYNGAVAKNAILRFWPFWAVYLIFLIITLPLSLVSALRDVGIGDRAAYLLFNCRETIVRAAEYQAEAGIVVGLLAVMLLFGYLYSSRGNTLMNSLPIRRETLFISLYVTGLLPMLLCQIFVAGITMLIALTHGIGITDILNWQVCSALGLIAFYGFACFCAMLTGNVIVLPVVYFVLNLAAAAFESCVKECLFALVYGAATSGNHFTFLSPIIQISDSLRVITKFPDSVQLDGIDVLAAYAAAGLVFSCLALLLYRKRRMETVSDFVAVPILKPVFRYCMSFGTAFVLAALMFENVFNRAVSGIQAACLMAVLLFAGALIGSFAAEMMLRRTVRVSPASWKGLVLVWAVCLLTVVTAEADLTGYEKRVPDPESVEKVEFWDTVFEDPVNIRMVTELHESFIWNKSQYDEIQNPYGIQTIASEGNEPGETQHTFVIPMCYMLKNGSRLSRQYTIPFSPNEVDQPDTMIGKIRALLNSQEGIESRMTTPIPVEEKYITYAVITMEKDDLTSQQYRLSPGEAVDLWNHAMLADAQEGKLSIYTIADTQKNLGEQTNMRIEIALQDAETENQAHWYHSYRVFTDSAHTLAWIGDHTDLNWVTLADLASERG